MKCDFRSSFVPLPNIEFKVLPRNSGFKLKRYSNSDHIDCIRTEFQKLYCEKYTHVMNMPGNFKEIKCASKHYNIVCLDARNTKFIAEFCSKKLNSCIK